MMVCSRCKGSGKVEAFFCGAQVEKVCPVCKKQDWFYHSLYGDASKLELIERV